MTKANQSYLEVAMVPSIARKTLFYSPNEITLFYASSSFSSWLGFRESGDAEQERDEEEISSLKKKILEKRNMRKLKEIVINDDGSDKAEEIVNS